MRKAFFLFQIFLTAIGYNVLGQGQGYIFWDGVLSTSQNSQEVLAVVRHKVYAVNEGQWDEKGILNSDNLRGIKIDDNGGVWAVYVNKLLFSDDEGENWEEMQLPISGNIRTFDVFGEYIFIGAWDTLFMKNISGSDSSWTLVYQGQYEDFTYTSEDIIYVSIYHFKILKSVDHGETWVETNWSKDVAGSTPGRLKARGSRVFVGTYWDALFYSDDQGQSWEKSNGLPDVDLPGGAGVGSISVFENNKVIVLMRDQLDMRGVFYSSDYGANFTRINTGLSHWSENLIQNFTYEDGTFYMNTRYRGFFMSQDATETWMEVNNGYNNLKPHTIQRLCMDAGGNLFTLMSKQSGGLGGPRTSYGILKSTDNGESWFEASDNLSDRFNTIEDIAVAPTGEAFASGYDPGTIHVSLDGGNYWELIQIGDTIYLGKDEKTDYSYERYSTIRLLKAVSQDTIFGGSYHDGLIVTTDGWNSWKKLFDDPSTFVFDLFVENNEIYVILRIGLNGTPGLYYSDDFGESWELKEIPGIRKITKQGDYLFGSNINSVYRSSDNGKSWILFSPYLSGNGRINDKIIVKHTEKNDTEYFIFVATNEGLYKSCIVNKDFVKVRDINIDQLFFNDHTNEFIFIMPEYLFSVEVDNFLIDGNDEDEEDQQEGDNSFDDEFVVFPNPAGDLLNIRFDQTISSFIVDVKDLTGSVVYTHRTTNTNELTLNISNLPRGVYFIQAVSGKTTYIEKVLLK